MSIHLQLQKQPNPSSSSSSSSDDEDQTFDDWNDSLFSGTKSLFDETTVGSVDEALRYDRDKYGVDLDVILEGLKEKTIGDGLGRVRLINWIRKTNPTPDEVKNLTGKEDLFVSEEYLIPVIQDDPLLQYTPSNDTWSDEDEAEAESSQVIPTDANARIRSLEKKLVQLQSNFAEYKEMVKDKMNLREVFQESSSIASSVRTVEEKQKEQRDDDSHYFESYGYNDIHATMIQDKIRTSTYARYILSSPSPSSSSQLLFENKTILDVGCGTSILSLFSARAGAKRVYAVDASSIAQKAEEIVQLNGLDGIVKVVRGKVEDVVLPRLDGDESGKGKGKEKEEGDEGEVKVDIIISEWMGYALLYESMLDSVLIARDRFLKPGGIMAPSQCRMMLALCDASEVKKERVDWWGDVYGFDMSPMSAPLYTEAIIDVVGPHTLLSSSFCVQDLYIPDVPSPSPSSSPGEKTSASPLTRFSSSFTLPSTTSYKKPVSAFVLYFDTFFTSDGTRISEDEGIEVRVVKENEAIEAEVWPLARRKSTTGTSGGKRGSRGRLVSRSSSDGTTLLEGGTITTEPTSEEKPEKPKRTITSFSTGPQSIPTHWKQTLFLLREPFLVDEGTTVTGTFICQKSPDNSRELEVEIRYSVKHPNAQKRKDEREEEEDEAEDVIVQMFKVC